MKFLAAFLLFAASTVNADDEGLTYTPNFDVAQHSRITLDQLDIKELVDSGNFAEALEIYQNGKNVVDILALVSVEGCVILVILIFVCCSI